MKRLLLVLALLSVILSGIALAQQVTITVFGGSGSHNYPTSGTAQYTMGGTSPLIRTDNSLFSTPITISQLNVTIDNIGQCYRPLVDDGSGTGTMIPGPEQCGTYQLCVQFDNEPIVATQCKTFLEMVGSPVPQKRTYTQLSFPVIPAKSVQSITYNYYTHGTNNLPSFRIRTVRWDGGISGNVVKPLNFFRNKTGPVTLGPLTGIVSLQGYLGDLKVTSSDNKVAAYFAPDQSYDPSSGETQITYNPSFPEQVIACINSFPSTSVDSLGNPICDYQHEQTCANLGSDWYNGVCCGDAYVNPNAESPPSDCKYYGTVAGLGNRVMNAICGKSGTNWAWAGQLDPGVITDFTTCGALTQVVATGTQFVTCGNTQNTAGITVNQLQGTIDISGHTYWCEGPQLRECGGSSPYSPTQYTKTTGTRVDINSEAYYCKSTGALTKSLDGDELGCTAAGFSWTGTKCCGEPDDPLKNYDDPSGQGVCVNNQVISQGSVTGIEQDILIHNGAYYFCNEQRTIGYTGTTTIADFPGVQINERGFCGTPLLNVKPTGADKNAICTPQGNWQFVEFTQNSIVEQTGWIPTTTQIQTGCCPTNMCWDGNQCRPSGQFISIGGKGYRCP